MTEAPGHRLGVLLVAGATAAATMFLFIAIRKRPAVFAHLRKICQPEVIIGLCFCRENICKANPA